MTEELDQRNELFDLLGVMLPYVNDQMLAEAIEEAGYGMEDLEGLFNADEFKSAQAETARKYTPEGFFSFYQIIFDRYPPNHVKGWVVGHFQALRRELNTLIEAFRGSTKSTTVTAYLAWYLGIHPTSSNLVVAKGDDDATDIVDLAADIIRNNPGWKIVFPNIVPDPDGSWGSSSGYDVKDTGVDYGEFRRERQKAGRAPSMKGVGYRSKYLPGPHPTGLFIVDDIYDYDSSLSEAELTRIEKIYNGTLLPMKEPETIHFLIGTPWKEDDLIAKKKKSSEYYDIKTPIRMPDGSPTWPEKWDNAAIEKKRRELDDDIEFELMYMCNVNVIQGLVLKRTSLKWFDHRKLYHENGTEKEWASFLGVDYTSTEDPKARRVDYFSLAKGKLFPDRTGGVITDGLRVRIDQAEAEGYVVQWAEYDEWLQEIGIEAVFSGKEFHTMMLRNMRLLALGMAPTPLRGGVFQESKGVRFEKVLQPAFKRSELYLSDIYLVGGSDVPQHTQEFFRAFEDEWSHWRGDKAAKLYHDDTIDAVFNVYWLMSQHFDLSAIGDRSGARYENYYRRKEKKKAKGVSRSKFVGAMTGQKRGN